MDKQEAFLAEAHLLSKRKWPLCCASLEWWVPAAGTSGEAVVPKAVVGSCLRKGAWLPQPWKPGEAGIKDTSLATVLIAGSPRLTDCTALLVVTEPKYEEHISRPELE